MPEDTPAPALSGFPWQEDGLTELESATLPIIKLIEGKDPALAAALHSAAWLADDVTEDEHFTLVIFMIIANNDVSLARSIFSFPWFLDDDLTEDERRWVNVVSFAVAESVPLTKRLASFSWLGDGITEDEGYAVASIGSVGEYDAPLAMRILDYPWVVDGINSGDRSVLSCINSMASKSVSLAQVFASFSWLIDGFTEHESWGITLVCSAAKDSIPLAQRFVSLPWLVDGITEHEAEVASELNAFRNSDVSLAEQALDIPWIFDGPLTEGEQVALQSIQTFAHVDLEVARAVMDSDFFDGTDRSLLSDFDISVRRFINSENVNTRDRWALIRGQPWFQDGLTAEEAALVVVLYNVLTRDKMFRDDHEMFQDFVQGGNVRSRTLSLTSGDVHLFLIRRPADQEVDDSAFEALRTAVEAMVDFMGPPWVKSDIIVYLDPNDPALSGTNRISHVRVFGHPEESQFKKVVYHELAHYYDGWLPLWLNEGWAEFAASYTLHVSEGADLQARFELAQKGVDNRCVPNDVTNVLEWIEAGDAILGLAACHYPPGESFLLGLYSSLGRDVVQAFLRDLYWNRIGVNAFTVPGGPMALEQYIYGVILSNTPTTKHEELRALYDRLHGGPIPSTDP